MATNTQYCGDVGAGLQGVGCADDLACAAGYGCDPSTFHCEHWCRLGSTMCPMSTACDLEAGVFFANEAFGRCL
jgi:hypothetical protein